MWLRHQEVGNVGKDAWRNTVCSTFIFPGRNGKCKISPDLVKGKKTNIVCERKIFFMIINWSGSKTQTWCCSTALSEWGHGIHESLSQKLWISCSRLNLLETFGGVLEEKVVSVFGLEQSEHGIIIIVSKLGLDRKSKINESEQPKKPSLGVFWRYVFFFICFVSQLKLLLVYQNSYGL